MKEYAERLLNCVPQTILKKYRESGLLSLEKQLRPVAVVFVDIESCTRLCEDLSPDKMNELIEGYFSRLFDVVESTDGSVNEITGDGFMAIFEGDEIRHVIRAAASAALAMQRQTSELNVRRPADLEPLLVNVGIHAGISLVGFTKFRTSAGERWTYTASGPVTNVASRLCSMATGGSIVVSADVAEHLDGGGHALEPLGPQALRNVSRPVVAFRLSESSVAV